MSKNMKLKFIHIPRTGGTSIEHFFRKHKINYGMYDQEYCTNIEHGYDIFQNRLGQNVFHSGRYWTYDPWHCILKTNSKLWQIYDFFLTIRNPLDRLISSYYCPFQPLKQLQKKYDETIDDFNNNIQDILLLVKKYPHAVGHYGLQINYINFYHLSKIHILLYDNFVKQLLSLISQYGINIEIFDTISGKSNKKFDTHDLNQKNIDLFNISYRTDIILYNTIKYNYCGNKNYVDHFQTVFE